MNHFHYVTFMNVTYCGIMRRQHDAEMPLHLDEGQQPGFHLVRRLLSITIDQPITSHIHRLQSCVACFGICGYLC